ncbi:hypothetical protein OAG76_04650 [Rubripirellula sp.]|nr:hypothetical protein [Rubripirellula sp.]MDB4634677.1 hypothetical protein [Rubripirellula sp.]MDC0288266.1 hypothetical protein [Rubripirellula sp.]
MATRVNTWIFQGNPETYGLTAALNTLDSFHWCVRQHKTEIEVGIKYISGRLYLMGACRGSLSSVAICPR